MKTDSESKFQQMTSTPVSKLIITLGIPTTITMLVTNVYNLVDTFFVSQLGTSASGATGVVFALMAILQAVGFMFGHGAGSNISRRLGSHDEKSAGTYASTAFAVTIVFSFIIMALGLIFLDPLMKLLGSTDTILPYSRTYGAFILISAPAMMSCFVLNNILRFEGKAAISMIGITSGAILNILLDPLFMFVFDMGIFGAGLSTCISQYISAFILLSNFLRGKTQSKLSIKNIKHIVSDSLIIMSTGMPSLVRQGLGSISTMLLNQAAAPYGDAAISAMSIVSRCCMFIFCVGLGIGQGFQPVAGFNFGARKYSRVRKGFNFTLLAGTLVLGVFAIAGLFVSGGIIEKFNPDPVVIEIGTFALRAQCVALFLVPISVCGNMLFQSIGKNVVATILSSLRNGVCFIPLILILPQFFGLTGIQLAQPISDVIASLVTIPFAIVFFRGLPKDDTDI